MYCRNLYKSVHGRRQCACSLFIKNNVQPFTIRKLSSSYKLFSKDDNSNVKETDSDELKEGLQSNNHKSLSYKNNIESTVSYAQDELKTTKYINDLPESFRPPKNKPSHPDKILYRKVVEHPLDRTLNILKDDVTEFFQRLKVNPVDTLRAPFSYQKNYQMEKAIFPSHCDVLVIGGGAVGTSIAYHIEEQAHGLRVVVLEKDLSYSKASTVLSVGGIRQQFNTPENIMMSKYGMDFLQLAEKNLKVEGEETHKIPITFSGYLTLASEAEFPELMQNYEIQKEYGSSVKLLTPKQLKQRFPWINVDGIEGGVLGVQREGWFDPWSFLVAMNRKTKEYGTNYVQGEAIKAFPKLTGDPFHHSHLRFPVRQINDIEVRLPDGEIRTITSANVVIAAGAWSGEVAKMCGIGSDYEGPLSFPLPVEPRKRYVYCVHSPDGPGLNCPLVIDPNGTYFRRDGLADLYLCGASPSPDEEPSCEDLEVDSKYFEDKIWPTLARRCPSFNKLKVHSSWAGYYDYNTLDQNAIIGRHPMFTNMYIATGFSGHGIQHAAAAGKAIAELIIDREFKTINLERFSIERLFLNKFSVKENCIY